MNRTAASGAAAPGWVGVLLGTFLAGAGGIAWLVGYRQRKKHAIF